MPLIAVADVSTAAASAKSPVQYAGEKKLNAIRERVVLRDICVKPAAAWQPGSRGTKGEFISDAQLSANYRKLASAASGAARNHDLTVAAEYQKREKTDKAVCAYLAGPKGAVAKVSTASVYETQSSTGATEVIAIGTTCAKVSGLWVPSTRVSGEYVADATFAGDYHAVAGHTSGKTKTTALADYKSWHNKATEYAAGCARLASSSSSGTPSPGSSPLKFSFAGAVGLAQSSTALSPSIDGHVLGHASTGTTGSNLADVSATGQTTDSVISGSVEITHFYIAPNDEVFVTFAAPVNLSNTSAQPAAGQGCVLAEVDPTTGVPTCVDSTLSSISWPALYSGDVLSGAPIQFDQNGAVYYKGTDSGGNTVLRKWANGVVTNLISSNVDVSSWLVIPNGTVFLTGQTESTGTSWTRLITPADSLQTLLSYGSNYLLQFPDGNVYMGTENNGDEYVARYLTASGMMDANAYMNGGSSETANVASLCPPPSGVGAGFCSFTGSVIQGAFQATNGDELVIAGAGGAGAAAMEYYPTPSYLTTEVEDVTVFEGVGDDLFLAGTDSGGNNLLTLYNTDTNTETQLLGPSNQIEIYHLSYNASDNSVWFDGLQFSNNQYVIGKVNLSTKAVTVVNGNTQKWSDLQAFGG